MILLDGTLLSLFFPNLSLTRFLLEIVSTSSHMFMLFPSLANTISPIEHYFKSDRLGNTFLASRVIESFHLSSGDHSCPIASNTPNPPT